MGARTSIRLVLIALLLAPAIGACASKDTAKEDVEDVVRADFKAENAKDIESFLALWTDNGLKTYDAGTRRELEDPKSEQAKNFGSEKARMVGSPEISVTDERATAVVDATLVASLAHTVFRLKFALVKKTDEWLFDGFEFVGSPPPGEGTEVIDIQALEYGFVLSTQTTDGNFALKFRNVGKQQHELAFFKGPDGVDVATAKKALQNVDGGTLVAPKGYESDHLSFSEPGDTMDVSFAEPMAPGTYLFACFVPDGGMTDDGEQKNPNGKPHIQLGMINKITVR